MKYVVDSKIMKQIDTLSINDYGISSLVLMERAAFSVTMDIVDSYMCNGNLDSGRDARVLCVCGSGNNGADGIAVARQLNERGFAVDILLASDKTGTQEYEVQLNSARKLELNIMSYDESVDFSRYNIIVDAIFGIGLSREITGLYATIINSINEAKAKYNFKIYAVDIASGVGADDGSIYGCAINADKTITFGYIKKGMLLYPGAGYSGEVIVRDAGFVPAKHLMKHLDGFGKCFTYEMEDLSRLPERKSDSNKGSYGKVLIVAGSETIGGAAILAGRAAYNCGTGLVKLMTHINNRNAILQTLPECLLSVYDKEINLPELNESIDWSSCIVVGPGLSKNAEAKELTRTILLRKDKMRIFDADSLNIIAQDNLELRGEDDTMKNGLHGWNVIITPHIMEMARLTGLSVEHIKNNIVEVAKEYAVKHQCIVVLKDARTVVTDGDNIYINTSGNDGMSTGGSGDVLTGIISALIATGMDSFGAAALGVFVHGKAGDVAAETVGKRVMTASNISDGIAYIMNR